ncbi:hypothetical protein [Polaromonas sp. CG9_12]|nr:hypothetical protein [Polaromonas sp. CG9_12]
MPLPRFVLNDKFFEATGKNRPYRIGHLGFSSGWVQGVQVLNSLPSRRNFSGHRFVRDGRIYTLPFAMPQPSANRKSYNWRASSITRLDQIGRFSRTGNEPAL